MKSNFQNDARILRYMEITIIGVFEAHFRAFLGSFQSPKILMLAIPATCAKSSSTKIQRSHLKRGTQCMFSPIGWSLFSNLLSIQLTQDKKKCLSKACSGAECK
ncbi:hypothetical protein H5410_030772, partial [Solanum commersonii]